MQKVENINNYMIEKIIEFILGEESDEPPERSIFLRRSNIVVSGTSPHSRLCAREASVRSLLGIR